MVVFKLMCFYAFVDPTTTTTTPEPTTTTTEPSTVSLRSTVKYTTASSTSFRTRTAIPDNTKSE